MKEEKTSVWSTIKFGGAFCGLMIGSGFASGQESLQFFGGFGIWGLAGILILLCLYQWGIPSLMGFGYDSIHDPKRRTYQYFMGKYLGTFMDYAVPVFLIGVMCTMCSGAGSLFEEFYGIPKFWGVALIVVAVFFTYILGLQKMVDIIGSTGVLIVFIMIVVYFYGIFSGNDFANVEENVVKYDILKGAPVWWLAPFVSFAYATSTSVPFITAVGATAKTKKEAVWGGRIGGLLMGLLEFALVFALLSNLTDIHDSSMPGLALAFRASPVLGYFFSIIVVLGLYSTAAPMMWMVCDKVPTKTKTQDIIVAAILACIALLSGQIPFGTMVNTIYPATGWVGLIFLICLLIRQIYNRTHKEHTEVVVTTEDKEKFRAEQKNK